MLLLGSARVVIAGVRSRVAIAGVRSRVVIAGVSSRVHGNSWD